MAQGYQDLTAHLAQIQQNPSTPLDSELLDAAALTLPSTVSPDQRRDLILYTYSLLPTLQQDPSPLIRLLDKLLERVPLSTILALDPPVDFITGLDLAAQPFNGLILNLLSKVTLLEVDGLLTSQPALVPALIQLWLCTEDGGVAEKTGNLIYQWLELDWREVNKTGGLGGSVWKRVFRDKDIYRQILSTCSLKSNEGVKLSKSRKTLAQARLLDQIPKIAALDWKTVTQSYHPELESEFGLKGEEAGLLDYVSLHMVDVKDDVLMHRTLIDFLASLLASANEPGGEYLSRTPTAAFEYLQSRGLYDRTVLYYTHPDHPSHDPIDSTFLYSAAANFVAACWTSNPQFFIQDKSLTRPIVNRIRQAVSISPARWAHGQAPTDDLHVLASAPRPLIRSLGVPDNPFYLLKTNIANADVFNTLATIFHGPLRDQEIRFPLTSETIIRDKHKPSEANSASVLYRTYIHQNPSIWSDTVRHASTVALGNEALAAVNLIKAVITANWASWTYAANSADPADYDKMADTVVPSDADTRPTSDPISSAILSDEASARATLVPYLLSPPKTFSNLVGGHGDAENAAYRIAVAKFDALRALYERIKERKEYASIAVLAKERLDEGVMGKGPEVGGRIATLEL